MGHKAGPLAAVNSTAVNEPIAYRACFMVRMRAVMDNLPSGTRWLIRTGVAAGGQTRYPQVADEQQPQSLTTTLTVCSGCMEQVR